MSDTSFHSVDFWKSAITTMPDNSFFELLRSVFGKIKTPFNKQQLVRDLELFLLREDVQKNIASYIDEDDASIITAVAVLDYPVPSDLEHFFSGELNYAELHDIIINLEERFILYRFREDGVYRLALNPVLAPVLETFIKDTSLLLPSFPAGAAEAGASVPFDDRILAGLLSFVSENPLFFKAEGGIRKRVAEAAETVFPDLELEPVIGGLRALGLFQADRENLLPDYRRFAAFGSLTPGERLEYCAAAMYCCQEREIPPALSFHLLRSRVRFLAGYMRRFLGSLEEGRLYPVKTLRRLAGILCRQSAGVLADNGFEQKKIDNGLIIQVLEKTGLLAAAVPEKEGGLRQLRPFAANAVKNTAAQVPFIAMDSGFSCLVYPEIACADAFSLAEILSVRETGTAVRFELTRESAVRAFDRGISADAIIELLQRLTALRIAETLVWTVKDWEKRYNEVTLRRGIVLNLSPERRYLAETKALAGLIIETLSPGVYLLDESAEASAEEVLRSAGVDIIAHGKTGDSAIGNTSLQRTAEATGGMLFPSLKAAVQSEAVPFAAPQSVLSAQNAPHGGQGKKKDAVSASTLIENFHTILNQMRLVETERDELSARIKRRLILCEAQLKDASVRYEKLEARGLDYVGKMNIAKQAISLQLPVEITLPVKADAEIKESRIFGIPKALEKEKNESVLVIEPYDAEPPLRIPLGKISLLRRIKKSIFETNELISKQN